MKPTIGRIVHFCIGLNYGEPALRAALHAALQDRVAEASPGLNLK